MKRHPHLICAALALGFATSAPVALAQAVAPAPEVAPQQPAPESTIPEQVYPCNPGSYEPPPGTDDERAAALADCEDGVIPPPPTGDDEVELAPPDAGTTPVIPPDAVPQQDGSSSTN